MYDGYLLNPANGRTVSLEGRRCRAEHLQRRRVHRVRRPAPRTATSPAAGLLSGFIGRDHFVLVPTGELDEDGFPIYDFADESSSGQFLGNAGVCEFLD